MKEPSTAELYRIHQRLDYERYRRDQFLAHVMKWLVVVATAVAVVAEVGLVCVAISLFSRGCLR